MCVYLFWVPKVELMFLKRSNVLKMRIISLLTVAKISTICFKYLAAFSFTSLF